MTTFSVGAATDVGQVRQVNQDNILRADDVFAVADGMGGHRGGEVASLVAVEALQASFIERTTDSLVEAVQSANAAIVNRAKDDPDLRGMGTTMCALARVHLDDGQEILTIVNVGDSRAYLLKVGDAELVQISEDHSLVQTLVRQGQLTQAEAAVHPQRNILTRALGIDQRVLPDSFDLLPVTGDRYLLCSDGLFNEVEEPRMAEVLLTHPDPQEAAEILVRLANEGGGRDNISVVVVEITGDAGHQPQIAELSDDHRVVNVVHGPERVGLPPDDAPPAPAPTAPAPAPTMADPASPVAAPPGAAPVVPPVGPPGAAAPIFAPPLAAAPRSRFTWRVGVFLVLVLAVFGVAAFAVSWVASNSYYVGLDNGEVVIFQGRPGGFLWFQPSVAQRTSIAAASVPAEFQADIVKGKTEPTLQDATEYVARIATSAVATTPSTNPPPPTTAPRSASSGVAGAISLAEAVTTSTTTPVSSPTTVP